VRPFGGGSIAGVDVEGVLVATVVALVVTAELGEAAVVADGEVVVAAVVVLVVVIAGVLEPMDAISAVDVEATRARGGVVETGGDELASTWAEASRISKMLTKARAKRTRRPIPVNAMTLVFMLVRRLTNKDANNVLTD
jgi:hypothetical protein